MCSRKFFAMRLKYFKIQYAKFKAHGFCISDFLRFDMSLLLLTVTLRGYLISIAYCSFFIFFIFAQNIDCGYLIEPPHL